MELYPAVVGVEAHGYVDELLVDEELQVLELGLLGVALEAAFCEDGLEGRALEGVVLVADDDHVVAAGSDGLRAGMSTPSIGEYKQSDFRTAGSPGV